MKHKYATAIVGVRGYSGLELARGLLRHPEAELRACFATDSAFALSDYLPEPQARRTPVLPLAELETAARGLDTVFLATPPEASMELAPRLLALGCRVVDLSGAFRLKGGSSEKTSALYRQWYGFEHRHPEWVEEAHYGLLPWLGPLGAQSPRLVANPGCYATAVLMALLPLLKARLIRPESVVIDAKSGTSGAGRKAVEGLLFTEVEGECLPYKVGAHQHFPEIQAAARSFSASEIDPMFSTSLIGVRRGIVAAVHARLSSPGVDVGGAFAQAYDGYGLARVTRLDAANERAALSLKRVVGTPRVHISYKVDGDKLYVFSQIDNLLKGAASQAIENFNRLHDWPLETALTGMEAVL